jgi:hypothetical protein
MSISVDLFYNPDKDTYKIFLQPDAYDSGDLSVYNLPRMLVSDKKHRDLFGKNVSITNLPDNYEHYIITNIQGLFDKLCNSEPSVTFTYCYKSDGRLYLCKTNGKEDDVKCKHAWLCNKLRGILAAGVIQFSKEGDTGKVYIDNMSGTYKTQPYNLEVFKLHFKNSFPGIDIELLTSPNTNPESRRKYCTVMTNSPDYDMLCKPTTSGGRNRKSNKKTNKRRSKRRNKRRSRRTKKRTSKNK